MKTIEEIITQSSKSLQLLGENYQIFRLAGDASSREYFRILYGDHQTCIAMLLPEGASSLAEEYSGEVKPNTTLPFVDVAQMLLDKGVPVPEIYVVDLENRVLLLEDFGDTLLYEKIIKNPQASLEKALALLALVATPGKNKNSIAFTRCFDQDLYMWEFKHYIEYGIEKIIKYKESDTIKLLDHFSSITQTYLSWEKQLTHRDFHSRNILWGDGGDLALIDFQDALMGPIYYDLASLLKDAYVKTPRPLQEKMALHYKNLLPPDFSDAQCSDDEFLFRFDLMSIHRNLKAAGRFVYIDQVKNNPSYLKDVPQSLEYVIETLSLHNKLKNIKQVLEPYCKQLIEEV